MSVAHYWLGFKANISDEFAENAKETRLSKSSEIKSEWYHQLFNQTWYISCVTQVTWFLAVLPQQLTLLLFYLDFSHLLSEIIDDSLELYDAYICKGDIGYKLFLTGTRFNLRILFRLILRFENIINDKFVVQQLFERGRFIVFEYFKH